MIRCTHLRTNRTAEKFEATQLEGRPFFRTESSKTITSKSSGVMIRHVKDVISLIFG
jgi:hypothetical protein